MTQAEFNKAQKTARENWLQVFRGMDKKIGKLYIDAANEVAAQIKTLEANRKGTNLTAKSLRQLEKTLRDTGQRIAQGTEQAIIGSINQTVNITNIPHEIYLNDAIAISQTTIITKTVIQEMFATINERMIELTYSRLWADGYSFSDRIWGSTEIIRGKTMKGLSYWWQKNIKDTVVTGFAQNRDIFQIAKDIQVYAADGKLKLMKRYGELERGTAKFAKRIPKYIDYRAIRIARSELYISMQEQAKLQGRLNPAVQLYRWNLTAGAIHECICPDLAVQGPYRENEIPGYPHPNCYKSGTKVYTNKGWIDFKYLRGDEFFLSLNPLSYKLEWVKAEHIQVIKVDEYLIELKGANIHLVTTKNHSNYVFSNFDDFKLKHMTSQQILDNLTGKIGFLTIYNADKSIFTIIKNIKSKLIKYKGYVYDVTLEKNHILWVMYKGKTCFSGNCLCYITHIIKARDEFVDDLINWGKGAIIPYLEEWYNNVYLPILR